MKAFSRVGLLLLSGAMLISACGSPKGTSTSDTSAVYTQIASTALAYQTQTALAVPTATSTPQFSPTPAASDTPASSPTPAAGTPSVTPPASKTPSTKPGASCDNMKYIADLTIPDGYIAAPGEYMYKTWEVQNLGPCSWNKNYVLIFGWGGTGTNWSTLGRVNLTKNVAPGESIDIKISLEAPKKPGNYSASFVLQNDKGSNFPPPALTVVITVK